MGNNYSCPACKQVPVGEVFQCKREHYICSKCVKDAKTCPTCAVDYKSQKNRSPKAEAFLDLVKFDCPFKSAGCPIQMHRNVYTRHVDEECKFKDFHLCKLIGFPDCTFSTKPQLPILLTSRHLCTCHSVGVHIGTSVELRLESFMEEMTSASRADSFLWPPTIVQLDKDIYGPSFLFICKANRYYGSWICVFMGTSQAEADKYQVEFSIPSQHLKGTVGMDTEYKWKMTPKPFRQIKGLLDNPPMTLPLRFIRGPQVVQKYKSPTGHASLAVKADIFKNRCTVQPVRLQFENANPYNRI